jgi:NAD(P)H-dependent flavin oxidoreductase YrpB (nitropropane dioxygenase family)
VTLRTPVCDLFGIELPIFSAGMGLAHALREDDAVAIVLALSGG